MGVLAPGVAAGRGLVLPGLNPLQFWADPSLVPAHWFLLISPRGRWVPDRVPGAAQALEAADIQVPAPALAHASSLLSSLSFLI